MSKVNDKWQQKQYKKDKGLLLIIKLVAFLVLCMIGALFYEISKIKQSLPQPEYLTPEQTFKSVLEKQNGEMPLEQTDKQTQQKPSDLLPLPQEME